MKNIKDPDFFFFINEAFLLPLPVGQCKDTSFSDFFERPLGLREWSGGAFVRQLGYSCRHSCSSWSIIFGQQ